MSTNNRNHKNNNNKRRKSTNWTAYKNRPRSVSITVYDIQGSPISEDVVNRIVSHAEESIKGSNIDTLAIAVNKG